MCNRPIGWRADASAVGDHVLIPVLCDEYVAALEAALGAAQEGQYGADSSARDAVRKSLGIGLLPHDTR